MKSLGRKLRHRGVIVALLGLIAFISYEWSGLVQ